MVLVEPISGSAAIKAEFAESISNIREELDEHLDTINQATEEVQSNYEYLFKLDEKVERLSEKLESVVLMLEKAGICAPQEEHKQIDLSEKEKRVFLVLYTSEKSLPVSEISKAVRESEFMVRSYIAGLVQKGIPIRRKFIGSVAHIKLDSRFRELQTKKNIVSMNQKTVSQFC